MPPIEGKPTSAKAQPNLHVSYILVTFLLSCGRKTYANQGSERTQTEGNILKIVYQATVATTKIEQTMYKSTSLSVFDPPSKLNWKDVCLSALLYPPTTQKTTYSR